MKVLLVSGHPAVLLGVRNLLSIEDGIELVGETSGTSDTMHLAEEARPDIVIVVDLLLAEGMSGVRLCREIKSFDEPPYVLVYTEHNSAEDLARYALAGVDGYLHTDTDLNKLLEATKNVWSGRAVWEVGAVQNGSRTKIHANMDKFRLSFREKEVLELVLKRYSNAEIAQQLFIGVRTVKAHVSSILRKLEARDRKQLLEYFSS